MEGHTHVYAYISMGTKNYRWEILLLISLHILLTWRIYLFLDKQVSTVQEAFCGSYPVLIFLAYPAGPSFLWVLCI